MEHDLKQQIPKFLEHFLVVPGFDCIEQLVNFLDGVKTNALMVLFAVPWTTVWCPQGCHDFQQFGNALGLP